MNKKMDILEKIKDIINTAVDGGVVSFGAVIATKNGKEVVRYSYGYQDIENNIPYSDNTIVRAFSCTKLFTAVSVFKCLEMGLFKLDEPISKYFPSFKNQVVRTNGENIPVKREIVIKDLLDMRAGLSYLEPGLDIGVDYMEIDTKLNKGKLSTFEFVDELASLPLLFSPGEDFHYSYCADVLGALIIKTSGISLRDFYKKYIIDPLGLKDTDFFVGDNNKHRIAKGYVINNGKLETVYHSTLGINTTGDINKFESGGAGLFMTLNDLNRYAQCLLNKTEGIISEESFKRIIEPEFTNKRSEIDNGYTYYNLIRRMYRPNDCLQECVVGEFGWNGALGTSLFVDPINKITLVVAFQSFDLVKWDLTNQIKDAIFKYLK